MASAIDPTKPVAGSPTTQSVRDNFAAAKSEIEVLQQTAGVGPQGPIGPVGPAGTITVNPTVITGIAGSNASVAVGGTPQAATLQFTIPRGDAGTGGSGITETQAVDAVRQGNPRFDEVPATTAVTFPTTPNAASAPVVGAGWTPTTGGTATQAYTHAAGNSNPLAYPVTIATGTFYQIVFSMTVVSGIPTTASATGLFSIFFRTAPTTTTGQQTVIADVSGNTTVTVRATGNFSHVAIVPAFNWQGTFTMTRVVAFTGAQNSAALSIKDWVATVRGSSAYIGGGGRLATGNNNIAVGFRASESITSGNDNVAVGVYALSRNLGGSNNTAIGPYAMENSESGGSNIAIGPYVMRNNTSGGSNIAIGQYTMQNNVWGSDNIAIGNYAMQGNTTGYGNTAIGYYACYVNKGHQYEHNVAVGRYTMYMYENSAVCIRNVAVGDWVGFAGSNNTGVGFQALAYQDGPPGEPVGSNLVAVGYQAGSYTASGNFDFGDNSVFLGANTKAAANSQTNQIVIGYNATGHGSHTITLGNSSITALHCQVQTISALSDSRVKEDIQPANLDKCLDAVKNLPVSRWAWQSIAGVRLDKHVTGFISDDVAKVFPKAVTKQDGWLTVRNAKGEAEMTPVTQTSNWAPDGQEKKTRTETRQVEKTVELKDLQYVSPTELLPTLWGAVQRLIQKNEELEQRLANPDPNPEPKPPEPKPESKGILHRRK